VLATPLLMSPILYFRKMSGFEPRDRVTNLASHPSHFDFSARLSGRHLSILANKRGDGGKEPKAGFHSATFLYIFLPG
jgi:hypothetical protein